MLITCWMRLSIFRRIWSLLTKDWMT
jgi:hypothetical protein